MKVTKYRAKKTIVDGHKFDSKREAEWYKRYREMEKRGEIKDLELQPRFLLQPSYKKNGRTVRKIEYVADFRFIECNLEETPHVVDVKGMKTPVYKMKKKMFEYQYPHLTIEEVR